jgi:hypothetical protein
MSMEDVPFEQRVFQMVLSALPDYAELAGYCAAAGMTPALVESLVETSEQAIGEPIRHSARKLFPAPLKLGIREEVELAWKAPKRVLHLSNKLSRPNYTMITARPFPRPKGGHYPADWGRFSVRIKHDAPQALELLQRLPSYAALSGAFMARADSPQWWSSMNAVHAERGLGPGSLVTKLRFYSEAGWAIGERLGWGTWLGPRCAREFGRIEAAELVQEQLDGGACVWITKEPFDFRRQEHLARYLALREQLARHVLP